MPNLPDALLLEGVVTTISVDGTANIAPMGPIVEAGFARLRLRPYQSSVTYQNLKRTGQGVLHVTDDVALIAQAAIGRLVPLPKLVAIEGVEGLVLADACRWYAFQVESIDDRAERTEILAHVIARGRMRDFFGFNRAKHAVVEAAILATRVRFLPSSQLREDFERLATIVRKTGGHQEHDAFDLLHRYVEEALQNEPRDPREAEER